ncbi:MAG: hypothetical protein NWE91_09050 [Candidatus Bathyarchaeota archaeon]|nr:hypothetical protein [Candidatus Bathyarchaeota archaeon]
MSGNQAQRDVEEEILHVLGARKLTPRELRKALPEDIARATYFRHKKKLLEGKKIEELKLMGEDEKYHKFLQVVNPRLIANQQDIELYLEEMESPIPEIRERGYKFFERLSNSKRVAWYFSPKFSPNPNFRTKKGVKDFFRKKLMWKGTLQMHLWNALDYMLAFEPEGSLWKTNLIDCTQEFAEDLVWDRTLTSAAVRAFQLLRKFPGKPLHDLTFDLIIKLDDAQFEDFYKDIVYVLLHSELAEEYKYLIRRKLDDLATQNAKLRERVEKILKEAKP